ncbi:hypothetical protein ALC56_08700 [Trachymyrmex septentrionalis]|uniref:Uncharacterized protein n=1 Tax=Trachymyrmex septentrionalis TaxID=34720 RepID=A0A195FA36_9HYME|nr:hypothetical protein ALC56_08700 [Trachymyrmex septentrionalis]
MGPRVINATGHPRSRRPSILARLGESSVVCRSRLAPGIVSSGNENDRSMTGGVETGDIPSVCAAPVDSFILLTQRMKREVSEGSIGGGKATELFAKTFCGTTSRREQRGRNSGNLPECPAGNRKMNFMIDADDAHPTHSSFPNGRYRGYTFASFLLPFLSLSLIENSALEEIAREKFQRVSRDAPRAEDVVGDLRSYKSSASAEQRSSGRDCSPIKCIRTVSGVGIRVGCRQREDRKKKKIYMKSAFRKFKGSHCGLTVDLLEGKPIDDHPEVVKKGKRNHHRPIVTETSRRIEDEGPIWRTRAKTPRSRLSGIASTTALLLLLLRRVPPETVIQCNVR